MNALIYQVALLIAGCIISVLCAYYFTTRNNEQKMNKIAEEVVVKAVTTHNEIKHQDSMYSYFEEQLGKHQTVCGAVTTASLKAMETKLQHMEIKEVKNSMILSGILRTVSIIAKKMKITDVEISTDTDKNGD